MLDRKIKNLDADEELLQDRKKYNYISFTIFLSVGWFTTLVGFILTPFKWDEVVIGLGISLLVIGGYFLVLVLQLDTLIYLKRQFEKGK